MLNKTIYFNMGLVIFVWSVWLLLTVPDSIRVIVDNWQVTLTMAFGSMIAGATSEGGGAIAFPVFTKVLHIQPHDAKVFSLAIQSIGMTAATFTIIVLRIPIAWSFVFFASIGGVFGVCIGAIYIAPLLQPNLIKMLFTTIISSFALTLWVVSWKDRLYNDCLPELRTNEKVLVVFIGVIGGIVTGLIGNGIDIICFSSMVLLFRLTEKIATPTSVILMALNSIVGFALHVFVLDGFTEQVKEYWLAAIPVVVIGAPLGAYLCTQLKNKTIAVMLIFLILIELISSLSLIPLTRETINISLSVFLVFSIIYILMLKVTLYMPKKNES